jgi:transposase
MRFVAVKSEDQQAILKPHKTSDLLVRQRTGLINALRPHMAAHGIVTSHGLGGVTARMSLPHEKDDILQSQA